MSGILLLFIIIICISGIHEKCPECGAKSFNLWRHNHNDMLVCQKCGHEKPAIYLLSK